MYNVCNNESNIFSQNPDWANTNFKLSWICDTDSGEAVVGTLDIFSVGCSLNWLT